jgi:hypothetical protein
MKFLCKIALLILTARVLAGTPRGSNKDLDTLGDFSLRDIAGGITSAVAKAGNAVRGLWEPAPAPPKAVALHSAGARHPAD